MGKTAKEAQLDQLSTGYLIDLEGLKRWIRADATILQGYAPLFEAVEFQGLARNW